MAHPALQPEHLYTYGDYLSWEGEERYELHDGVPVLMTPAPSEPHQRISIRLSAAFINGIRESGSECRAYAAPLDIRLPEGNEADEKIRTVLQPDLLIVCDRSKIDERGVRGAPDLVVEILSSGSVRKDVFKKMALYEKHGVPEYWIVYPKDALLNRYRLTDGLYGKPELFSARESIAVECAGFTVDLATVFEG